MQTEAEAFLQRIRAFPDDDAPRLIFADWLDEQAAGPDGSLGAEWGGDRARFIRVQIALARLAEEATEAHEGDGPEHARRAELADELAVVEQALLGTHEGEWTAPFRGLATGLVFRRGFVDEVKVAARQFLRHSHELFATGPVRHLHLLDVGGSLPAAFQSPYLDRLAAFTVHAQHAGEHLARATARCPYLAGLRRLRLSRNRFEDDAAEHLAGSTVLTRLEELDLSENELGETGARALAASPHLACVRRLELGGNRLGPAGAEALAGSSRLTSLWRLGLAGNEIGAARLHSLSRAHDLLRVPVLDLAANGLTAAGLRVILNRPPEPPDPAARGIRELDLGHNELGDDGARVLADSPHLTGLRVLRLVGCAIGDAGARSLAESPHLTDLAELSLENNPISDAGFRPFLNVPHLRSLRRLGIPRIGVSITMQRLLAMRYRRPRL